MVFHCTAGKDRTGLMAMLLLGALGVPDDDIVRDYELTTHYRSSKRLVDPASATRGGGRRRRRRAARSSPRRRR